MTIGAPDSDLATDVAAMRRFARFFTRQLKVIEPKHLHTDFSLPEARVVYELAQRAPLSPGQLAKDLDIDAGQLSRLLQGLEQRQVITRDPAASDKRQVDIALTAEGRNAFADLNARTEAHVEQQLKQLDPAARARVVGAMARIERELGAEGGAGARWRHPRTCFRRRGFWLCRSTLGCWRCLQLSRLRQLLQLQLW